MLRLSNVKILRDGIIKKVNIYIENEQIIEISEKSLSCGYEEVDLNGLLALPGGIDAHVHFDDPGFTAREDFETGTKSAVAGGITTVFDMPCTSIPAVLDEHSFNHKLEIVTKKAFCDFAFWGGATPNLIDTGLYKDTLSQLTWQGVIGIKFYTISGMKDYPRMDLEQLHTAFVALKELDLLAGVHCEEYDLVNLFTNCAKSKGLNQPRDWCKGRVYEAEEIAILKVGLVAREVGNKLHIVHVSSLKGLEAVDRLRKEGVNISCETCPHFLIFSESDFERLGSILKTAPPVRRHEDSEALWRGLIDGKIDFVTSDHAGGIYPDEKSFPDIWQNYAGIPGTQLILPVLLTFGYHKRKMSLERLQQVFSENPARKFGLEKKGKIEEGYTADLTIVDPDEEWEFSSRMLFCKNKYSPFEGFRFKGKVKMVMLHGSFVFNDQVGFLTEKPSGRLLRRT